jgi:hypothetical protein
MKLVDFIKRNGKTILIIVFALLWLRGCVQRCSGNGQIRGYKGDIQALDSVIAERDHTIKEKDATIKMQQTEIEKRDIIIEQQTATIEKLDKAASKSITVRPPQVIIKKEDLEDER